MFKFSILESRCHYWGPKAVAPSLRYYIHVSPWIITGKVTLCIRESSQAMYYYIQPGCRVANPIDLVIRSRHSIGRLHCMPKWRPWSSHTSGECFSTRLDRPCILSNPWTEVDNDSRLSKYSCAFSMWTIVYFLPFAPVVDAGKRKRQNRSNVYFHTVFILPYSNLFNKVRISLYGGPLKGGSVKWCYPLSYSHYYLLFTWIYPSNPTTHHGLSINFSHLRCNKILAEVSSS
jgi:hypothetical protein